MSRHRMPSTTTAQPPYTPWVGFPHRAGQHSTVALALDSATAQQLSPAQPTAGPGGLRDAGARQAQIELWRYPAAQDPGDRPRLLVIHGFRGDHHGLQLLVNALPEFEILVPDLPGFGQSPPVRTSGGQRVEHTVELYAQLIDALAEHSGLGTQDLLVGHSFGSTLAAAHVSSHRRRWAALALSAPISQGIFSGSLFPGAAAVELYYRIAGLLPERAADALLRSPAALMVTNLTMGVEEDPQVRAYVREQHRQHFGGYCDRQSLLEAYRASSRHTVADYAAQLNLPVALLPGAKDQLSTARGRRRLRADVPQAYTETIRGAGHLLHYEKPAQLARALRRFVDQL